MAAYTSIQDQLISGRKLQTNDETISLLDLFNIQNTFYKESGIGGRTNITDLSDATELKQLLMALDIALLELLVVSDSELAQAFLSTSTGSYLDLLADEWNIGRFQGTKAIGVVRLHINGIPTLPIRVTTGTTFDAPSLGLSFKSTENAIFTKDKQTLYVNIIADDVGEKYNLPKSTITQSERVTDLLSSDIDNPELQHISGLTYSVINEEATFGGLDKESDIELRNRLKIKARASSIGTTDWYDAIIRSVDQSIHDSVIYIDTEPTGSEKPYRFYVVYNLYNRNLLVGDHISDNVKDIINRLNLSIRQNLLYSDNHLLDHNFSKGDLVFGKPKTVDITFTTPVYKSPDDESNWKNFWSFSRTKADSSSDDVDSCHPEDKKCNNPCIISSDGWKTRGKGFNTDSIDKINNTPTTPDNDNSGVWHCFHDDCGCCNRGSSFEITMNNSEDSTVKDWIEEEYQKVLDKIAALVGSNNFTVVEMRFDDFSYQIKGSNLPGTNLYCLHTDSTDVNTWPLNKNEQDNLSAYEITTLRDIEKHLVCDIDGKVYTNGSSTSDTSTINKVKIQGHKPSNHEYNDNIWAPTSYYDVKEVFANDIKDNVMGKANVNGYSFIVSTGFIPETSSGCSEANPNLCNVDLHVSDFQVSYYGTATYNDSVDEGICEINVARPFPILMRIKYLSSDSISNISNHNTIYNLVRSFIYGGDNASNGDSYVGLKVGEGFDNEPIKNNLMKALEYNNNLIDQITNISFAKKDPDNPNPVYEPYISIPYDYAITLMSEDDLELILDE